MIIRHTAFPYPFREEEDESYQIPVAKVMDGYRGRAKAFRPRSVVNVSGMSFGSLSGPAVAAMNQGVALAGCLQNTGEGGSLLIT